MPRNKGQRGSKQSVAQVCSGNLAAALARADGTAQPWNEVFHMPGRTETPAALEQRFAAAQQIERAALELPGAVVLGCAQECGLERATLDDYVRVCGLDVDVGVGSLVLVLNALPGVTTLSSCSSFHAGSHEEEALVAFTAESAELARSIASACGGEDGQHFRASREDAVSLPKGKRRCFQSYIVFSAANDSNGKPDARRRFEDLMAIAVKLKTLVGTSGGRVDEIAAKRSRTTAGVEECAKARFLLPASRPLSLASTWVSEQECPYALFSVDSGSPPCHGAQLKLVRAELVEKLKGLQPVETQEVFALVRPLLPETLQTLPELKALQVELSAPDFRRVLSGVTGSSSSSSPSSSSAALALPHAISALSSSPPTLTLVAIPPGGFWLPQVLCDGREGDISFLLFLTEDAWSAEDGGEVELYGSGAATPVVTMLPRFNSLVVLEGHVAIGVRKVITDRAPVVALHGLFRRRRGEVAPPAPSVAAPWVDASAEATNQPFAEADRRALNGVVENQLLEKKRMEDAQGKFAVASHIAIPDFLCQDLASAVAEATRQQEDTNDVGAWKLAGPARVRRHLKFDSAVSGPEASCPAGIKLAKVADSLGSDTFARYIFAISGLRRCTGTVVKAEARRFRKNVDYLRKQSCSAGPTLDVTLCLTGGSKKAWKSAGGGADVYAEAAEEEEEQEEEEEGVCSPPALFASSRAPLESLLRAPPGFNVLRIVLRDPCTEHFVEPVTARAPGSRWDVHLSYQVEDLAGSSSSEDSEAVEEDDDLGEGEEEEEEEEDSAAAE